MMRDLLSSNVRRCLLGATLVSAISVSMPAMAFASAEASNTAVLAQQSSISGVVVDENNAPLTGASVIIEGTTRGDITNEKGAFTVTSVKPGTVLEVSYIGYVTKKVTVGTESNISVTLEPDALNVETMVVIGFGQQKKINLTGSVSAVGGEELTKRPVTNPSTMLQAQVPGLRVVQGSGQPGSEGVSFRIRGEGTFSGAGNNPLILINGVEGSLDAVDPNAIESVSVLKDAASAAIYGSRAANGVVLITTKDGTGTKSKASFSYNGNFAIYQPTRMLDIVTNSVDYMNLFNQAHKNSNLSDRYSDKIINDYRNNPGNPQYPSFDWLDYMFSNSFVQNHNLSVMGNSESTSYNISLNYVNQPGTMRGFEYKKYNATVDLKANVKPWLKVGTYIGLKRGDRSQPRQGDSDSFLSTLSQAPTYSPWLPDDGSGITRWSNSAYAWEPHNKNIPAIIATDNLAKTTDYDVNGQFFFDANLAKGLVWSTKAAVRYTSSRTSDWKAVIPIYNFHTGVETDKLDTGGKGLDVNDAASFYKNLYTTLKYDYSSKSGHSFGIMAGYSYEDYNYKSLNGYRKDYAFPLYQLAAGGTTGQTTGGTSYDWALMSGFFRANYNYKERYLVEFSGRYDGTSRISKDSRWGFFPSFSAAWRLTEEQFIKDLDLKWLNSVKFRGSYGKLGNQNIVASIAGVDQPYPYQALISKIGSYPFDNTNLSDAYMQTAYANSNLKWESTSIGVAAVDIQLFRGLNITFEWYKKKTTDILRQAQVSSLMGLSAPTINDGEMENKGIELQVNWNDQIGTGANAFQYNVGFYIDRSRNKLTKFGADEIGGATLKSEGLPWNSFYTYKAMGIFANEAEVADAPKQFNDKTLPGDIRYEDVNGDKVIDTKDRTVVDGRYPNFEYSINAGASWKGFDLSLLFQGVAGRKTLIDTDSWGVVPFRQGSAPTFEYLEGMWTPENPNNAKYPKLYWDNLGGSKNNRQSTYFLHDISYFRLKNLTFGYTIPERLTQKIAISRLRVYFSGDNLATATPYKGLDPERAGDGRYAAYPQNRIFSFGVNLTF